MKPKAYVGGGKIGKVAHRVMSPMEWGSCEPHKPADEENKRKAISKR